jgi:butyryl-CoA dehydrogenase
MDFTYTPEQRELQARAASLAAAIMVHEEACEAGNGLPPDVHATR